MQTINYNIGSLVGQDIQIFEPDHSYVRRALHKKISFEEYAFLLKTVKVIRVSKEFRKIIAELRDAVAQTVFIKFPRQIHS